MSNVTPGYIFTGPSDALTYQKLNLLGSPTVTIGAGEVTLSMLAPLSSAGRLVGSGLASAAVTSYLINDTGLSFIGLSNGLTVGGASGDSMLAIGQSASRYGSMRWLYNGTAANAQLEFFSTNSLRVGSGVGYGVAIVVNGFASSGAESVVFDAAYNVIMGIGTVATGATNGFMFISNCAGTPSGTPAPAYNPNGSTPMIYDKTANKIWFYNGSWRGVVVT